MVKLILTVVSVAALLMSSCQTNTEQVEDEDYYFSLKDYFIKEANRLENTNSAIHKEVTRNLATETKEIVISDWEVEFGLFIDSDINKLGWKDSYETIEKQDSTIYIRKDSLLRTQKIIIINRDSKVTEVFVENHVKNALYESNEQLHYYTDSLYIIEKTQKVRVLGENKYTILGRF